MLDRMLAAQYQIKPSLGLSYEVQDLLQHMLQPDPFRRITLFQVTQHPWYKENLPNEIAQNMPTRNGVGGAPQSTQPES